MAEPCGRNNSGMGMIPAAAALVSVIVPLTALLKEDGFLRETVLYGRNPQMYAEILVWMALFAAVVLLGRSAPARYGLLALLGAAFVWLHVTALPALVSGLFFCAVILTGTSLRRLLGTGRRREILPGADFVLGASAFITVFCVMSVFRAGQVRNMQAVSVILGASAAAHNRRLIAELARRVRDAAGRKANGDGGEAKDRRTAALAAWILLMLLIQIGRMNRLQDFDSLWYGLRSEYVLAVGGGIYDDPGMIGMVYVYSKGFEVLTLPLSDLSSYAYTFFFNIWLLILGFYGVYRLARHYMGSGLSLLAAALCASVPAITNMAITAKADIITWVLQILMLAFFCEGIRAVPETADPEEVPEAAAMARARWFNLTIGTYLLSLTMKPTALIFSTALFGMMGISLLAGRILPVRQMCRNAAILLFPAAALAGIWARTFKMTGMPVMSVFTSIFEKLGFELHYPFQVSGIPAEYEEGGSAVGIVGRRIFQMLLWPAGKDMRHVILAWGGPLMFFLIVSAAAVAVHMRGRKVRKRLPGTGSHLARSLHLVVWPFFLVNAASLAMLYQVDGNYYIMACSLVILLFCGILDRAGNGIRRPVAAALVPVLLCSLFITANTSWAWSSGFYPMKLLNKGRVNDFAEEHIRMMEYGNTAIWDILAKDKDTRVIAFGIHPYCLQFPCLVQSYKELYYPWGDDAIVADAAALEEYMEYAQTDYVYAEAWYMGPKQYPWGYQLVCDMIRDGSLGDIVLENGNALMRVMDEPVPEEQALLNLQNFEEVYCQSEPEEWSEAEITAKIRREMEERR